MELSEREIWGLVHGIGLGSFFLLSYGATMVWFRSYSSDLISEKGKKLRRKRMVPAVWIIALVCWLTVITGTFIAYPWYRAIPPEGADLLRYPQALLNSDEKTAGWHHWGMEWKEHVAWLSPFLATAVAFVATWFGESIAENAYVRKGLMVLLTLAFVTAAIAALLGALITKKAPII